jgi:hypothetical protein
MPFCDSCGQQTKWPRKYREFHCCSDYGLRYQVLRHHHTWGQWREELKSWWKRVYCCWEGHDLRAVPYDLAIRPFVACECSRCSERFAVWYTSGRQG